MRSLFFDNDEKSSGSGSSQARNVRADDQAQSLGPVGPYEPIVITFGWWTSMAKSKKPDAGVVKRLSIKALTCSQLSDAA